MKSSCDEKCSRLLGVSRAKGRIATVTAELPEQVEMTLQRHGDDLVVHLINLSGARHKNYGPALPISGGKLRIRGLRDARARALVAAVDCKTETEGDALVVGLPEFGRFEVVVLERGAR